MRRVVVATTAALLAVTLAACAPGNSPTEGGSATEGESVTTPSSSSRPPFQTTTPGAVGPTGTPADVPAARWDAIVRDLAGRGVTATPTLVSAENVVFADGSLGCPSPGQSYTQAQVDGMRVVVAAGGATYDYRLGTDDQLVLCTR
jgi:hypothetical protein